MLVKGTRQNKKKNTIQILFLLTLYVYMCIFLYVFNETIYSLLEGKVLHENYILYTRESYIAEVAGQLNH